MAVGIQVGYQNSRDIAFIGHAAPQIFLRENGVGDSLFKCIAASYASIDINGDGVFLLADLGISPHFYRMLPYLITLLVLAFTSKKSRAPKAEGIPYDKSTR